MCPRHGESSPVRRSGRVPDRGLLNELYSGEHKPCLIVIPAGVFHGWKCVGEREAYVVNIPSQPYNREEPDQYRMDSA